MFGTIRDMSKLIIKVDGKSNVKDESKHSILTAHSFYGGFDRGKCVNITIMSANDNIASCELTEAQALDLANRIIENYE